MTSPNAPALDATPVGELEGARPGLPGAPGRRWIQLALWVVVGCLVVRAFPLVREAALHRSPCFTVYYTLSRLLVRGGALAATYDDATFAAELGHVQPGLVDVNVNPPTTALLALPLAGLALPTARVAWTAINLALLFAAVGWIAWEAGLGSGWVPALVAAAIACEPIVANLDLGQAYIAMLVLEVFAWHAYRRDRSASLGVALGLMLALKVAGVLLLLLLVVERRWRALAWTAGTGAALVCACWPWTSLVAWRGFATALSRAGRAPEATVTAYQTLPGIIGHLTVPDTLWNPAPLFRTPEIGGWLAVGSAILAAGLLVVLARRASVTSASRFAAYATAGVALTPLALDYHYALLLLPVALLVGGARRSGQPLTWCALGVAVLLLGADLPYRSPRLAPGAWALLAYPKLYGAMLLCALALWRWPHDHRQETSHARA
ncbi:MAG: DUF2029 domain-containing protein [Acidobacteriia bacterium]|nr:DUF2029 domain-containing protein [Terriglobia bacterium]